MATVNPDNAEITCKNPDCPKVVFKWNTILKHLGTAKSCRKFYNEEEIVSIRDTSKSLRQLIQAEKNRKENKPVGKNNILTSGKQIFPKSKTKCKICKKMYIALLTHLNQSEKCKLMYGNEYDLLKLTKKQDKKEYIKGYKSQSQFKDSRRQANADYLLKNKKKILEKTGA